MDVKKPDIFTTRPAYEGPRYSKAMIKAELKNAGIDIINIEVVEGYTQPDGSTVYYVYLN